MVGEFKLLKFSNKRTDGFLSKKGANVFLFPNTTKRQKMSYDDRLDEEHIDKIRQLVNEIKTINGLPISLVGISSGAVSVGSYIAGHEREVDGAVLMSAIYLNSQKPKRRFYLMHEVIGTKPNTRILIIHHDSNGCKICQPSSSQDFYDNI